MATDRGTEQTHDVAMKRAITAALLTAITGLTPVVIDAAGAGGKRLPWWRDPSIQCQLNLTALQVSRLTVIFNRGLPARRVLNERIRQLDAKFRRAMQDDDEALLTELVPQGEELRRQQNTRRSLMLVEMYGTLTPVQRAGLATIHTTGASRCSTHTSADPTRTSQTGTRR